jgi:chromosome segregation protein
VYLKRLEIKGFKSFADNTEINFRPGINIVVGPNGCGKSNVVDSIRWVLGEANVRNLRGHKSEDVIFNGTDNKKALSMAHVEMLLDNSDQLLPLDYVEIMLTRKVFRNGESEFYINKSRVRMKDISALFTGTGLGKKGYSIISQGELEQVLNGQALDRRLILEEASGIIKYRQQRDEVKRRLDNTGNDMLRLGDIIREVSDRQEELSRKADRARAHLELSQECTQLERKLLSAELLKGGQDLQRKRDELLQRHNDITLLEQTLTEQEEQLTNAENRLAEQQQELNSRREQEYQVQTYLNSLKGELRLSEERIKNRQDRMQQCHADEKKYSQMLVRINQDLEANRQDFLSQEENCRLREEEYRILEEEITELENKLKTMQGSFVKEKAQVFDKTTEETRLKNQMSAQEERLKKLGERKARLVIRADELTKRLGKYNSDYELLQGQIRHYESELEGNRNTLSVMQERYSILREEYRKIEDKYAHLNQQGVKIKNSLLSLQEMAQNLTGYPAAIKSLMQAAKNSKLKGIMGIPGEIIDVPPGLELAIDIAVGRGLQNVVTDTVEHARQAIEFLKLYKLGRVTFLPLDTLKVQKVPHGVLQEIECQKAVVGLASRVVGYDSSYALAIEYLLGRVLIVENMNAAISIFKHIKYPLRIVSLEGDLINVSGAVSGGIKPSPYGNSPLLRRGEEKRLLKEQKDNELARSNLQKELSDLQAEMESLEQEISKMKHSQMENKMALEVRSKQADEIANAINNSQEEIKSFQEESEDLRRQMDKLQTEMIAIQVQLSKTQEESQQAAAELETLKDNIEMQQRDLEVSRERYSSQREQVEMKKRELDNIRKNMAQFEQVQLSYNQSVLEATEVHKRLQDENQEESTKIAEIRQQIREQEDILAHLVEKIARLKKVYHSCNQDINSLRRSIIPLREQLEVMSRQVHNLELAVARLETELASLKVKWEEKFYDAVDENNQLLTPAQMKEYGLKIEQLKVELDNLGPVDPESIREHEEIQERFQFLSRQYEDMVEACDSLTTLLSETEKLMSKNFSQFFQLANESFSHTFKEIFNGGDAYLQMERGKERLEAGVDIEVKLPGKRPQSLNLLSGGERALTCIAFIFSLLRLKPAPFCLLDEIDAALDETNLIRFAHFLKSMSAKIQFIIITHRQATIEIGENIYGITMPEKGISSVLTLNLLEAESLAG